MSDHKTSEQLLVEIREQRQANLKRKQRKLLEAGIGPKELIWLMGELAKSEFVDPKQYTNPGTQAELLAEPDWTDELAAQYKKKLGVSKEQLLEIYEAHGF